MEKIYPAQPDKCKLIKAKTDTVRFLLDYSKSLSVVDHKGMTFERNLN